MLGASDQLWKGLARQRAATTEWVTSDERSHARQIRHRRQRLTRERLDNNCDGLVVIFHRPKCHIGYST